MTEKENDLAVRLHAIFRMEAEDRLRVLSAGLLELEKAPALEGKTGIVETIFREAHSLKGAARAVNRTDVEAVYQSLESVMAVLKRGRLDLSPELFDFLHLVVDTTGLMITGSAGQTDVTDILRQLARLEEGLPVTTPVAGTGGRGNGGMPPRPGESRQPASSSKVEAAGAVKAFNSDSPFLSETVRIATSKLDSLLLQAEEMLTVKLSAAHMAADLGDIKNMLEQWDKECAKIQPETKSIKGARAFSHDTKLVDFLERNDIRVKELKGKIKVMASRADQDYRHFNGIVDHLLEDLKKALMLPFSSILEPFPRMVRELAKAQGKEIHLVVRGSEVELDKRILEAIKDPLVHLIRNSVDHGIEKPEERERRKKSRHGTITAAIAQLSGDRVEIVIADDGAGINLTKVKEAAVRPGILEEVEFASLEEQAAIDLIFQPEVSTSPMITDLSGRGLGLAIVRERVEKIGGRIAVETGDHSGTVFRIILPVTIATFRGILVKVSDRLFLVPAANVERVIRVRREDIKTVENKEIVTLNGRVVALSHLSDVLDLPRQGKGEHPKRANFLFLLILGAGDKRLAFTVDEVLYEQEVLVKNLGKQLSRVRNISGATVLGTGAVVPVLNVSDLIKSAVKRSPSAAVTEAAPGEGKVEKRRVLVVEDSITSRILLKSIIESAGYQVVTAVDGVDALTALKTEEFHLVVSDVEMPRMNGFDLTARIRSDNRLSQLPVVLVTGLGAAEDRERGIDVGASAYIVKSSFNHSNLLDIIGRLV